MIGSSARGGAVDGVTPAPDQPSIALAVHFGLVDAAPGDVFRFSILSADGTTTWRTELVDCNFYVYGGRVGPHIRRAAEGPILNVAKDTSDGRPGGGLLISVPEQHLEGGAPT